MEIRVCIFLLLTLVPACVSNPKIGLKGKSFVFKDSQFYHCEVLVLWELDQKTLNGSED